MFFTQCAADFVLVGFFVDAVGDEDEAVFAEVVGVDKLAADVVAECGDDGCVWLGAEVAFGVDAGLAVAVERGGCSFEG